MTRLAEFHYQCFMENWFFIFWLKFLNQFSKLEFFHQCSFSFSPIFQIEFFRLIFWFGIFCWFQFFSLIFQVKIFYAYFLTKNLFTIALFLFDQFSDLKFYRQQLKFFLSTSRLKFFTQPKIFSLNKPIFSTDIPTKILYNNISSYNFFKLFPFFHPFFNYNFSGWNPNV